MTVSLYSLISIVPVDDHIITLDTAHITAVHAILSMLCYFCPFFRVQSWTEPHAQKRHASQ